MASRNTLLWMRNLGVTSKQSLRFDHHDGLTSTNVLQIAGDRVVRAERLWRGVSGESLVATFVDTGHLERLGRHRHRFAVFLRSRRTFVHDGR